MNVPMLLSIIHLFSFFFFFCIQILSISVVMFRTATSSTRKTASLVLPHQLGLVVLAVVLRDATFGLADGGWLAS